MSASCLITSTLLLGDEGVAADPGVGVAEDGAGWNYVCGPGDYPVFY